MNKHSGRMLLEPLTERELAILQLIAGGLSNRVIGQRLDISTETVKWYNKRMFAKLDVSSRTHAVARARELGLLQEAPLSASPPRHHNLPAPLTSFVGRENDLVAIVNLLRSNRLLTLTGTGGAGKTRLALEVAHALLDHYRDGVTFVNLAPIDEPDLLPDMVARTLGVKEEAGEPLLSTLQRFFARKQTLLILDNFEHLLPGATPVAGWLSAATQLTVLATSREPLRLYGEQLYPVAPLEVQTDATKVAPASQLFIDRARAANPDLEFPEESVSAVSKICMLLDGLPLAIELAAARSRLFSPSTLLARLNGSFSTDRSTHALPLLTGGPRDRSSRQQAVTATIDWSYHLIDTREQQLFRRLSVFAGGCTLEAVEAVCDVDTDPSGYVMDLLSSLIDKNMLHVSTGPEGEPRFRLLHVMREYAHERLDRLGETGKLRERHAQFFLQLAEQASAELRGPQQVQWFDRLESDHDNFRTALRWIKRTDATKSGLKLATALWRFWLYRGHVREGRQWLEEMLALGTSAPAERRAAVLYCIGEMALHQRDLAAALAAHKNSVAIRRNLDDHAGLAYSLVMLGIVLIEMGRFREADLFMSESLALARELGDQQRITYALIGLGLSAVNQGRIDGARSMFQEALQLLRVLGDQMGISATLNNLGVAALYGGQNERARQLFERSLDVVRPLQAPGQYHTNAIGLAVAVTRLGQLSRARSLLEEAIYAFLELHDRLRIAQCLEGVAEIEYVQQDYERAVMLWGAAAALRNQMQAPLPPAERRAQKRTEASVRAAMSSAEFKRAWNEGHELALDDFDALIAMALEQTAQPHDDSHPEKSLLAGLTPREIEVLRLVAQGMTDAEVAEALVISPRTVNAHLTSIYSKLGVNSRTAATLTAQHYGLV